MKKLTQLFVTFAFAFMAAFSVSSVAEVNLSNNTVHADVFAGKEVSSDDANSGEANKIMKTIYKAANIFSGFVLGISIIMIIVGGLRYILANGDQRQAEQGKMILIYSGIGIVIALSAFVIARLFSGLKFG
ncbi:pilin [Bacillus cereus]|uniref:pilin n=1 Tax=Bacillus cereus TaxID=1396 RepID=UPI000B4B2854|nr:pilin [Bacillus cereus]